MLQPVVFLVIVSNSRTWARFWLSRAPNVRLRHRLLIYGAGDAGAQTAAAVSNGGEFELLGFVDDDAAKIGRHINGVPVFGPSSVAEIVERLGVSDILLALPSASPRRRHQIIEGLRSLPVHIRTLPGMADLASGRVSLSDFRELDLEDLLGRDPVPPNPALLARDLAGKVGAGDRCGRQYRFRTCSSDPWSRSRPGFCLSSTVSSVSTPFTRSWKRRLVERSSPGHAASTAGGNGRPCLAMCVTTERMSEIFRAYRPDTVYHAAAYKHVPMVEHNPCEGVRNNVLGTLNVARAAMEMRRCELGSRFDRQGGASDERHGSEQAHR